MPPENPYAAPQLIEPPAVVLPELSDDIVASFDLIRQGAQLALKATWLGFVACFVVGVGAALPELSDLVPLMLLILVGAAAFCFLLGLVAFGQVTPAAGIRRLMQIALGAFAVSLVLSLVEGWVMPPHDRMFRMAWNALNNVVSLVYLVAFLWGLARLGRVLQDRIVTRWATIAAWAWGAFYALVSGLLLLGAMSASLREQIVQYLASQNRPGLIAFVSILGILVLVGLFGFIRALWRLKNIEAG